LARAKETPIFLQRALEREMVIKVPATAFSRRFLRARAR